MPFEHGARNYLVAVFVAFAAWFPLGVSALLIADRILSIRGLAEWFFIATIQRDLLVVHALLTAVTFLGVALRLFVPSPEGPLRVGAPIEARAVLRDPFTWLSSAILLLLFAIAVFGPWLSPHDPDAVNASNKFAGPSWDHWFGTDKFGKDMLTRLVYALGDELWFAAWVTGIGVAAATVVAYAASRLLPYSGRVARVGSLLLGAGPLWCVLAVMVAFDLYSADHIHVALALSAGVFVAASLRLLSAGQQNNGRPRDWLTANLVTIGSSASIALASVVMIRTTLSFLGFYEIGRANLGTDLARGFREGTEYPHLIVFPTLVLSLLLFAFVLAAQTLHTAEPKQ